MAPSDGTTTLRYHETADRTRYQTLSGPELRENFLIDGVFEAGVIRLVYWDQDRTILGGAVPAGKALTLGAPEAMRCDYFLERRELGVINIGGRGSIEVDGTRHELNKYDGIYIGRGSQSVSFASDNQDEPAVFYLLSYPAHQTYPTTLIPRDAANRLDLGDQATANKRTIFQMIHPNGVKSCQLVMGFTTLEPGSVWNTFPPHTHQRRTEVYLYFDLQPEAVVAHFLGAPESTRHLFVHDRQAALSPAWSIHCGSGSSAYSFIWGMGGENQRFDDMDQVKMTELV